MILVMVLTIFGATSTNARRKAMMPAETFTVKVQNLSGDPLENSKVFIGGGHQNPLTVVIDTQITDINGECEFSVPAGVYTLYVLGPDENGSAVEGLGAALKSMYLPNIRFISVVAGEDNDQIFTLIKRPKYWSVEATMLALEK